MPKNNIFFSENDLESYLEIYGKSKSSNKDLSNKNTIRYMVEWLMEEQYLQGKPLYQFDESVYDKVIFDSQKNNRIRTQMGYVMYRVAAIHGLYKFCVDRFGYSNIGDGFRKVYNKKRSDYNNLSSEKSGVSYLFSSTAQLESWLDSVLDEEVEKATSKHKIFLTAKYFMVIFLLCYFEPRQLAGLTTQDINIGDNTINGVKVSEIAMEYISMGADLISPDGNKEDPILDRIVISVPSYSKTLTSKISYCITRVNKKLLALGCGRSISIDIIRLTSIFNKMYRDEKTFIEKFDKLPPDDFREKKYEQYKDEGYFRNTFDNEVSNLYNKWVEYYYSM